VTSTPGSGHIHPLVPLAAELQAAGHDVLWATAEEACAQVERYGFRATPAGLPGAERRRRFAERAGAVLPRLGERERRAVLLPVMFGEIATPPMLRDLVSVFDSFQPDVVIHDLVEFAAAPIAAARGIPHVTVSFGCALSPALIAVAAASVADVWTSVGTLPSPSAGLYDPLYLHPLPAGFGLPPGTDSAMSIQPMHFDGAAGSDVPPWIVDFGHDRRGVYVTFGTEMAQLAPWPAVIEAIGSIDADFVVTLGAQVDAGTLGAAPDNVRLEQYVPQTWLLDRVSAVASHAGSGTLFATAARGIPQLCIPIAADQWENSDALAATGAAISLEVHQRAADDIYDAMVTLLDGRQHTSAALTLADAFTALPHPRDHVATIEALV
jgi:hypothetical protein